MVPRTYYKARAHPLVHVSQFSYHQSPFAGAFVTARGRNCLLLTSRQLLPWQIIYQDTEFVSQTLTSKIFSSIIYFINWLYRNRITLGPLLGQWVSELAGAEARLRRLTGDAQARVTIRGL